MGRETFKRPLTSRGLRVLGSGDGDVVLPTESVTGSTAVQTLSNHGVSFVTYGTSGKANDFIIPNPPRAGAVKYIFAVNNTTSVELSFHTASSGSVFFGTTMNAISCAAASTGSPGGTPAGSMMVGLVGASTSQWAVFPGSTFNWDFVGSTGSTGQA